MQTDSFVIQNPIGLHARPAALFVQTAGRFKSKITVQNMSRGTPPVDAKSILSVMTLGVSQGHEIKVSADGEDEQAAMESIGRLIKSDFTEVDKSSS